MHSTAPATEISAQNSRHSRLFILVVFALLIGMTLFAALNPIRQHSIFRDQLNNAGHVVVFGLITLVTYGILPVWGILGMRRLILSAFSSLLLGLLVEFAQYFHPTRDASIADILRDGLGVLGAICFAGLWRVPRHLSRFQLRWRVIGIVVSSVIFVIGLTPLLLLSLDLVQRDRLAPEIFSPENRWWDEFVVVDQADFWIDHAPSDWPREGEVMSVKFNNRRVSMIGLRDPYPKWTDATQLIVELYSRMDHPVDLQIRIHDARHNDDYHDRFNTSIELHPGYQRIEIPLQQIQHAPKNRRMDLEAIAAINFFTWNSNEVVFISLGRIWLE